MAPRSQASAASLTRPAHDRATLWSAFLRGDPRFDGRFVAAVRTTGIFCRPSCTCRKPRPEHVEYFATAEAAARAGFRPCKRCRPELAGGAAEADRRLAASVLARVREAPAERWPLARLARALAMSPSTLARRFRAGDGRGVARAVRAVRLERAADRLRAGASVIEAAMECGFTSPSAFARAFRRHAGVAPSEVRRGHTSTTAGRRSA
jgi:methylphosphotriester-DNA--protein-cysteine methyltransferase